MQEFFEHPLEESRSGADMRSTAGEIEGINPTWIAQRFVWIYEQLKGLQSRCNTSLDVRGLYNELRELARLSVCPEQSRAVLAYLRERRILEDLRAIYQEIQFNSELARIPV